MASMQLETNNRLLWSTESVLETCSWLLQILTSQLGQMHLKAEALGSLEFLIPE